MENIITNKQITQMVNEEMSEDDFFDQIDSWNERDNYHSFWEFDTSVKTKGEEYLAIFYTYSNTQYEKGKEDAELLKNSKFYCVFMATKAEQAEDIYENGDSYTSKFTFIGSSDNIHDLMKVVHNKCKTFGEEHKTQVLNSYIAALSLP